MHTSRCSPEQRGREAARLHSLGAAAFVLEGQVQVAQVRQAGDSLVQVWPPDRAADVFHEQTLRAPRDSSWQQKLPMRVLTCTRCLQADKGAVSKAGLQRPNVRRRGVLMTHAASCLKMHQATQEVVGNGERQPHLQAGEVARRSEAEAAQHVVAAPDGQAPQTGRPGQLQQDCVQRRFWRLLQIVIVLRINTGNLGSANLAVLAISQEGFQSH